MMKLRQTKIGTESDDALFEDNNSTILSAISSPCIENDEQGFANSILKDDTFGRSDNGMKESVVEEEYDNYQRNNSTVKIKNKKKKDKKRP